MTKEQEITDRIEEIQEVRAAIEWLENDCPFDELKDIPDMFVDEFLGYIKHHAHVSLNYGDYHDAMSFLEILIDNKAYVDIEEGSALDVVLNMLAQEMRSNHYWELVTHLRDLEMGKP